GDTVSRRACPCAGAPVLASANRHQHWTCGLARQAGRTFRGPHLLRASGLGRYSLDQRHTFLGILSRPPHPKPSGPSIARLRAKGRMYVTRMENRSRPGCDPVVDDEHFAGVERATEWVPGEVVGIQRNRPAAHRRVLRASFGYAGSGLRGSIAVSTRDRGDIDSEF